MNITEKYTCLKAKLRDILSQQDHMSFTLDMWSSRRQQSYICITVHFWSDQGIQTYSLATKDVEEAHTAENIKNWIGLVMEDYTIKPSPVIAMVGENGFNIVSAPKDLSSEHGWLHMRCISHTLQLCVQECLKQADIARVLGAARHLVRYFRHSPKAMTEARNLYQRTKLPEMPEKFELVPDCSTLKCLSMHQWLIRQYLETLQRSRSGHLEMVDTNSLLIPLLVDLLEPAGTATTFLEGDHHVTLSSLLPVLILLVMKYLGDKHTNQDGQASRFRQAMTESLKRRFGTSVLANGCNIFKRETFIDPRYRSTYFSRSNNVGVKGFIELELVESLSELPVMQGESGHGTPPASVSASLGEWLRCGKIDDGSNGTASESDFEAQISW